MDKKATLAAAAMAALAMAAGCAQNSTTVKTATTTAGKGGECYGVNACKGTGECGGPGHSCAGQNTCKGQGWITLTPAACEGRHGTFKNG